MMKKMVHTILVAGFMLALAACGPGAAPDQPQREEMTASIGSSETANQTFFKNSVFLGDSITEGLSYHDVLKDENVLAGAGKTAEFALEDLDELARRAPEQIFIQLGSDDILWPTDQPKAYSMKHYAKLIDQIKARLPHARVTILTVTPVTADAKSKEPRYENINDYNQGLQELAKSAHIGFIDLASIFAEEPDLYDTDGIHFKPEFYTRMLQLLKDQVK